MIQKATYVGFYETVHTLWLDGTSQCIAALVLTPLGPVALATLFDYRLEPWRQHTLGGQCHALVLDAADPQWAAFLIARLRDVHPALGLRTVAHPLQAGGQILEIRLQIVCIHRLGHVINPNGFVAMEQPKTCL